MILSGSLFGLAAGLFWGLVFVAPLMLPEYPAVVQSVARYLAFGLICLPLAWLDRKALRALSRADWRAALHLSLVGNLLYYSFLAASIQRTGGPVTTLIIGTLPVVIAVTANLQARGAIFAQPGQSSSEERIAWSRLLPPLVLILVGIGLVHQAEYAAITASGRSPGEFFLGVVLAFGALLCWTWYPLHNAAWLRGHPGRQPRVWATAQGMAILPVLLIAYGMLWWVLPDEGPAGFAMPLGPDPVFFVGLMLLLGLFASWLGTVCWNAASQRLPPTLAGPLIVFETLAALAYTYIWRGQWPETVTLAGIVFLVLGVVWGVRAGAQNRSAQT